MNFPNQDEIINVIEAGTHEGWCTHCKEWTHDCCEPDARKYKCPICQNNTCCGAEELLFMI